MRTIGIINMFWYLFYLYMCVQFIYTCILKEFGCVEETRSRRESSPPVRQRLSLLGRLRLLYTYRHRTTANKQVGR